MTQIAEYIGNKNETIIEVSRLLHWTLFQKTDDYTTKRQKQENREGKFSFFTHALLKEEKNKNVSMLNFLSRFLCPASFSTSRFYREELNPTCKTKTRAKIFFRQLSKNIRNFDNKIIAIKMKTMIFLIMSFIGLLYLPSCKKDTTSICENLLDQGNANLSSLKGEWEFKHFAYTANGNKVKNQDDIQKGYINITDTGSIWFYHTNTIHYLFTLDNSNGIFITQNGSTYINPPQEEISVSNAFNNAICYVIKDNQLFIHYDGDNKKNVLILNKK